MAKLYLMCGLSGSGKSCFVQQFKANKDIFVVEVDELYRVFNGDECIHRNSFEVWHTVYRILRVAEQEKRDTILDTNALSRSERKQIRVWFPSFEPHLICIHCDRERILSQISGRKRKIPPEAFAAMEAEYEEPTIWEEGWASVRIYENTNDGFVLREESIDGTTQK